MSDESRDLVQGTLEMLVLKTLALEPMHGYGIALRIEQISDGVFRVNPGSLLPALNRMERAGYVKSEWRVSATNRRAKYYVLTKRGLKALERGTAAVGSPDGGDRQNSRSIRRFPDAVPEFFEWDQVALPPKCT